MRRAAVAVVALGLTGCALFTAQRVRELVDVGCVIAHYEAPDSVVAAECGLLADDVPAARAQAVKAAAASLEHPRVARLAHPDGGAP